MKKLVMSLALIVFLGMVGVANAGEVNFTPYELDSAAPLFVKSFYSVLKSKLEEAKKDCPCYFQTNHFLSIWMNTEGERAIGLAIDGESPREENIVAFLVLEKVSKNGVLLKMLAGRIIVGIFMGLEKAECY